MTAIPSTSSGWSGELLCSIRALGLHETCSTSYSSAPCFALHFQYVTCLVFPQCRPVQCYAGCKYISLSSRPLPFISSAPHHLYVVGPELRSEEHTSEL